ncbi:MAG: TraV family lipoprotein, partial [Bacteroidia bacterium]|nr:TraV family lipoprotein [Bacteroidia bacterium]
KAMFERLKGLLNEPETTLLMTPKVVRVLFLPYKSDGNILMMPRYAYFFLDEPQWVLGNYLNLKGDE